MLSGLLGLEPFIPLLCYLTMLSLERVSLTTKVGQQQILKDISFEVKASDRLAIVGPTGSGKTSLLRLLNRLSEPTSGSIYLEGKDYRTLQAIELRRQVILVLQEPKLLGMTGRAAIAYPLQLRGLKPTEISQRLSTWTEQLRIPQQWLDRSSVQLSGGQRQAISLCRALVVQPKILLLDEPTSALDAGRASHTIGVLSELASSGQMTILMANHQLDLAREFSTRVLHLQGGELMQYLPREQMDWERLRETFAAAEEQAVEEW